MGLPVLAPPRRTRTCLLHDGDPALVAVFALTAASGDLLTARMRLRDHTDH